MSTPPTHASGHGANTTPATALSRATGTPASAARQSSGQDLFAGLLSLLSAGPALPSGSDPSDSASLSAQPEPNEAAAGDRSADPLALAAASGTAWAGSDHPLAALLAWSHTPSAWSSLPALGGEASGSSGSGGAPANLLADQPAGAVTAFPASAAAGATVSGPGTSGTGNSGPDRDGAASAAPAAPTLAPSPVGVTASNAAAASAAWLPAPASSPLPAGMSALAQPAPLSADSAAALAREGNAGNVQADAAALVADGPTAPASAAPRAGPAWRSTTAMAQHVSTQATQAGSGATVSHGPALMAGLLPGVGLADSGGSARTRSTVLLDERFAASSGSLGMGSVSGGDASAQGSGAGQSGSGQTGSDGRSAAIDWQAAHGGSAAAEGDAERSLSDPAGDQDAHAQAALASDEADPDQWPATNLPQNLRQASLRVGDSGEDAIDIRLSLSGEQLSVDFRSDDPNTRDRLQDNADAALGDLLQRSGLQLGGVSVGSQTLAQDGSRGQGAPQGSASGAARTPAGAGGVAADSTAGAPAPAPRPGPRSDGSQPLDLFV